MSNTYLVTGAAGFIGQALCSRLLNDGHRVTGIDNFSRGKRDTEFLKLESHQNFTFYDHDLTCGVPEKINQNFTGVIHLAGIVGVENVMDEPFDVFQINIKMITEVLNWMRKNNVGSFLYLSSSEVYGWHEQLVIPTPEDVSIILPSLESPRSGYALSKIQGEFLTHTLCKQLYIPYSILRPHNVYGPRMGHSHVIPQLWNKIKSSESVLVKNPHFTRAFCYIDDAISQITDSLNAPLNTVENVGNDSSEIEIFDLAKRMAQILNKTIQIKSELYEQDIFQRRCPNMNTRDNRFGKKAYISIDEGLQRTLSWYEKNH